uniref:Ig-like domain-containing protein n=1 Tax=Astyanax mexicanus TaxID=7994 RepID=A0A3B1J533_ASTMX
RSLTSFVNFHFAKLFGKHSQNWLVLYSHGYYYSQWAKCTFSSDDLSDVEYIETYIFGKTKEVQFKSSWGIYVGYTDLGMEKAAYWNNISVVEIARADLGVCKEIIFERNYTAMSKKGLSLKHFVSTYSAMLICSAYNFYPKHINITWLRDGQRVTGGVTYTEEMADGDWYYQSHAYLEYDPKPWENISCLVEHASFKQPRTYQWGETETRLIFLHFIQFTIRIFSNTAGLLLGTVTATAGLIFYLRHRRGESGGGECRTGLFK